ncbi:MAG: response regulator [Pseudomonadota bacterium]
MTAPRERAEILLVEDEPADAHLTRFAFEEAGIAVHLHHVSHGFAALDFLHRRPPYGDAPRPGLILLDLNMPRMNGYEFMTALRGEPGFADIPVVVLTTSDVERDVEATRDHGAADYIVKPVDMDAFCHRMSRLAGEWRLPRSGGEPNGDKAE